jgi:hypothetical protein
MFTVMVVVMKPIAASQTSRLFAGHASKTFVAGAGECKT